MIRNCHGVCPPYLLVLSPKIAPNVSSTQQNFIWDTKRSLETCANVVRTYGHTNTKTVM